MDVKVTKVGDGRIRKFVGGRWFNLHRDERFAKVQAAALVNEWHRLRLCGATDCLTVSGKLKRAIMTAEEKKTVKKPKPTFTLEELRILWKLAWPGARMYMLMGLSLGRTQKEIATMRKDDLVEKDGELFIDKLRNKTGVPGYWWVFPELATMLSSRVATTPENPDNLAFLTSNGLPR
jgi:hypothetical protein